MRGLIILVVLGLVVSAWFGVDLAKHLPDLSNSSGRDAQGARGIVEAAVAVALPYGAYMASDHRPDDAGSDHSRNDANRAARDIGVRGVNLHHGPPPQQLDDAIVGIGNMFGRAYRRGRPVKDEFHWRGFRVQIFWRIMDPWGHMGHIHVGARRHS